MTRDEKIELWVLAVIAIILLLLWRRNALLGIPTSLNLPQLLGLSAAPDVQGETFSPLADPGLNDPNGLPFLGGYSCMCGHTS